MQVRWTTAAASLPDGFITLLLNVSIVPHCLKRKRDFSLRRPTHSQERMRKKKHRPAPFEMTEGVDSLKKSARSVRNDGQAWGGMG
jgi:hypothetical protein